METGRPSQQNLSSAERTIRFLEQRRRLRPCEQKNLEEARAVVARAQQKAKEQAEERLNPEGALQARIERAEEGMLRFAKSAREKIRKNVDDDKLQAMLDIPFQILEHNARNNATKNMLTFRRMRQPLPSQTASPVFDMYELPHSGTYLYGEHPPATLHPVAGTVQGTSTRYSPTERTLYLQRDIDPSSSLDMLGIYHELVHVGQDNAARNRMSGEGEYTNYVLFHTHPIDQPQNTRIESEQIAYALELELLNALADNQLRSPLLHDRSLENLMKTVPFLQQEVGKKSSRGRYVALGAEIFMIPSYFPHGSPTELPPEFCQEVNKIYAGKNLCRYPDFQFAFPSFTSADTTFAKRVCFVRPGARL